MNDPKLLYVVNSPEAFLESRAAVAQKAMAKGFTVDIASPTGKRFHDLSLIGDEVFKYPLNRSSINPIPEIHSLNVLKSILDKSNPDLVHTVAWKAIVLGGIAARRSEIGATVHTIAGLGYAFSSNKAKPRLIRSMLRWGIRYVCKHPNSRIIVQNSDDYSYVVNRFGIPSNQVTLIRSSGVDLNKYVHVSAPKGIPIIVLPSRLLWSKGVEEFVEAAKILRKNGAEARFVLVGETDTGNPDGIPEAILRQWHEEKAIEWWGYQSDMNRIYAQAHVVCLPSKYREGVPRVLLEAASSGRPIVTTDAPGCRDACVNGETGFLVPVGDPNGLADALKKLIVDKSLRTVMGEKSRKLMENSFSEKDVVTRTLNVYDELLSNVASSKN